jgi:hypothetical protein
MDAIIIGNIFIILYYLSSDGVIKGSTTMMV